MTDIVGSGAIVIETSSVDGAITKLDTLASTGPKVEASIKGIEGAAVRTGKSLASLGAGVGSGLDGVAQKVAPATQALDGLGMSAKATANAMRQVPAQFQDIVVSLQAGQAPFTVLAQQGSQLATVFGGAGNAAKAMAVYVTKLVTPLTVAAGAAAALAVAYSQGSAEAQEFRRSLILTGSAAGVTASQLSEMAAAVAQIGGGTKGKAAEVLNQIAQSGAVGAAGLVKLTDAAVRFEKVGGAAATDTAKAFIELGKAPFDASVKLNQVTNALSFETIKQVKALEDQGRALDAARVAQEAYAAAINARAPELRANLGFLESAWNSVSGAAKKAWDSMLDVGRAATPEENLAALRKRIAETQRQLENGGFDTTGGGAAVGRGLGPRERAEKQALLESLKEQARLYGTVETAARSAAAAEGERARMAKAGTEWLKEGDKYLTQRAQMEREVAQAEAQGRSLVAAGLIKEKDLRERIAAIREKFAPKGKTEEQKALEAEAKLFAELAGLEGDFAGEWASLNKAYKDGRISTDQLVESQSKLLAKQPIIAKGIRDQEDAAKAEAKAIAEAAQAHEKYSASLQSGLDKILADIKAQQEHTERLGLSKTAIAELDAAKLEMLATDKELQAIKVLDRNLDTEQYNLLKQQAQAYRDLAKAKVGGAVKEDAMDAAKKTAEEWKRATDDINRSLTDALLRGFESGKGFAQNFADTIKNLFKSLVLRPVISAIVNPVAGQIAGGLGGLLGTGSAFSNGLAGVDVLNRGGIAGLGGAGGLYGLMSGSGFLGTASSVAGGVFGGIGELSSLGFGEALSGGLGALTSGSIGTGLATLTGVLGPIALGLGALSALAKAVDHSGTPHTGASSSFSSGAGLLVGAGLNGVGSKAGDYSAQTEQFTTGIVQGIVGILDSTAATFGKQAGYTAAAAFADDSSKDGAWGALAIKLGEQMVSGFGAEGNGRWPGTGFADGEAGTKQYLAAVSADVRSALDGIGLPSWAQGMLDKLGAAPTIEQLAGTVAQINATQSALVNLGGALPQLASVSGDAVTALLTAFGGVEALTQAAGSYYQNFYSDAERAASATQQITKALGDMGLSLPNSREGFRSLVEAQDLTTESGRNAYAALLKLSPAFAEITAATATLADTTTKAAEQMAEAGRQALASLAGDQASLMVDLLRAQGNSAGADSLARQQALDKITAGLSATDAAAALAAYDYNDALRKQIEALNAAKTASEQLADLQKQQAAEALAQQQAIASQRTGLESQLLQLQGNTAALRERELAALDPSNRALQDQIYALQDQQAAAAAAAQALQALQSTLNSLGNTRFDLENQLLGLQGKGAEVLARTRERDLAQLTGGLSAEDAARVTAAYDLNAALRKQISDTEAAQKAAEDLATAQAQAAAEQTRAAEQIKSAWQSVTNSIFDEVARIRGLMGESSGQSFASAQAQFAITTAQARAGDQEAAKLLPSLSQTLLRLAESQATSLAELQFLRAQTAGSLLGTAGQLSSRYGLAVPSFAVGTDYVPHDMLAKVHEGERIVPRAFNPAAGGSGVNNTELINEIRALRAEVTELRKQADVSNTNTGRAASALEGRQSAPFLVEIAV